MLLWFGLYHAPVQHIAGDLIPKHKQYSEPNKSNNSVWIPFYFKNRDLFLLKEDYALWEMPEDKLLVCFFATCVWATFCTPTEKYNTTKQHKEYMTVQ